MVLQSRKPLVDCAALVDHDFIHTLRSYLDAQTARKCGLSYSCDSPGAGTNFNCVDRLSPSLSSPAHTFFSRESTEVTGISISGDVYPDFLDTLTMPLVFRDGSMQSPIDDYVDIQTDKISVLNLLYCPRARSGSLLEVTFQYAGAGKVTGSYLLKSYVQMSSSAWSDYTALTWLSFTICFIDVLLLVMGIQDNIKERKIWLQAIKLDNVL